MAYPRPLAYAVWLVVPAALAGCAGNLPFAVGEAHQTQAARYSADGSTLLSASSPDSSLAAAPNTPSQIARSIGTSVTQTVQTVGDKISSALEIEPKVIPADDPTTLANMPKTVHHSLYVQSAFWSERNGNLEAAQQQYERALQQAPEELAVMVHYARFLDRQGRGDDAIRLYQRALAIEPGNVRVLNDLGLCYARQGRFQLAQLPLRDAVAGQPDNPRYRNNLASVLIAAGQTEAAIETLQQIHPPAVAHYNAGCLLVRHRKLDEAARHLAYSVQLDPHFPSSHAMLAQVHDQLRVAANAQPRGLPPTF